MASSKRKMNRRTALAEAARMTGAVCLGGFSLAALIQSTAKADARAMRPPGAQPEADFLSACVRCGLCVQACPYGTLSLAEWGQEPPVGTPFFTPREVPCYMCRDVPCARACPTGALDSTIAIRDAEMGVAVLVGHEDCLNYKGMNCSICVRVCPIRGDAITLEPGEANGRAIMIPTVHSDKHCVTGHASIRVLPRDLGLGGQGRNRAGRAT